MTDAEKVQAAKLQLEAAQFNSKYEDGEELALPQVSTEGVTVTWVFEPATGYKDGKVVASTVKGPAKGSAIMELGSAGSERS